MSNAVNKTISIYIESGEAQKALDALLKKETNLKDALSKATDPALVKRLETELKKLEEPIDRARKKLSGELSPSLKDTEAAAAAVRREFRAMSEEDAGFEDKLRLFKASTKELEEQRVKMGFLQRAMKSFWQEAKTVAVGVVIGNTVESMLTTVMGYISGMVTGSAKIADELADIEKTTGLTGDQVRKLNSELSKIDTRSSNEELRKLAAEAGKLGAGSVEDVQKFVEAADKINVALGEDLGDGALVALGKLSKIFKVEMLNIGSAINEIGASSEASESFAVDFLNRLAGTGPAVKLSADQLLGYGAALEVAGQTAEVSGTALSTFFIEFVRDAGKFGKTAGFAKGELEALINTKGTNEGFLQFLTRLKEQNPDMDQFLAKMQQLGIDGSRGANVLLALANNIEGVRTQQETANKAIQSSSSIMDEFNKKNNNAAADLDKLKKNFASLFTSSTIQDAAAAGIRTLNSFLNVIKGIPEFVEENRFALLTLVAGILLLNKTYLAAAIASGRDTAAKVLNAAVTRASAIASNIAAASQAAYIVVTNLLSGSITRAAAAQRLWNVAMSIGAGPLGIILTMAGLLVVGLSQLVGRTRELTAAQRVQADISQRVTDSTADTLETMRQLTAVASDNNVSLEGRKKALADLIALNPEYLKGLTLENLKTDEGRRILDEYVGSLRKKAELEAKSALLSEKLKARNQAQFDRDKAAANLPKGLAGQLGAAALDLVGVGAYAQFDDAKKAVSSLDAEISVLQKDIDAAAKANIANLVATAGTATTTTGTLVSGLGKVSDASKKAKDDLAELAEELRKMAIDLMPDGPAKEVAQLEEKYGQLRKRAQGNNKLLLEIERLYRFELDGIIKAHTQKSLQDQDKFTKEQLDKEKLKLASLQRMGSVVVGEQFRELGKELGGFASAERMAGLQLNILRSSGRQRLAFQRQLLDEEYQQDLKTKVKSLADKALLDEEYERKRQELTKKFVFDEVDAWLQNVNSALNIVGMLDEAKTARENAELERDRRLNDNKKQNLERRLKSGVLSQMQYDREVAVIEKAQEERDKEVKAKQFKRSQRMQVIQALMNGAMAITSTLAAIPGPLDIATLGAARIVQIALVAASTAAQVATISKQKPPEYGRGGKLYGPSHSDRSKGMPVVHPYTGQVQAYVEGGELIGNKRMASDGRRYNISGTPSQIMSYLNGVNGGVTWTTGAQLRPAWHHAKPVGMSFSGVNNSINQVRSFYAAGGVFGGKMSDGANSNQPGMSAELMEVIQGLSGTVEGLAQTVAMLQHNGIQATVGLNSFEDARDRRDQVRRDATMKG